MWMRKWLPGGGGAAPGHQRGKPAIKAITEEDQLLWARNKWLLAHPDANEDGYVEMPNVDMVKEITDGMAASQAFSANVTAFNLLKSVISKGLEIGK